MSYAPGLACNKTQFANGKFWLAISIPIGQKGTADVVMLFCEIIYSIK